MDLVVEYRRFAECLRHVSGESPELLHINAGLAIWLICRFLLRRRARSFVPLAIVLAAAIGNEIMDRLYLGAWESSASVDIFNSCAWPAILSVASLSGPRGRRPEH